ncbi:unnamed protein product [Clonostachys chloroleuca]|uniref:Fungal lipase-type domain-containing protein n=1 Tax=Clonostachys chloroleuca TaxID=1926264 RepID=A0AA35LS55_9HYPO|nr:unnamed protein product [Clonostachys chloroleuca]
MEETELIVSSPSRHYGETIEEAMKVQVALLNIQAGDEPLTEEAFGKGQSDLDNTGMLKRVQEMKDSGDLQQAINFLSSGNDKRLKPDVEVLEASVKVAQLFAIMCDTVYMVDMDREWAIYEALRPYAGDLEVALANNKPLPESVVEVMKQVTARPDRATEKMKEVANAMGLEYKPLGISSIWTNGGPYCGAFYAKKPAPFIVMAFKGTGRWNEWWTNIKIWPRVVEPWTKLKGRCHTGFYGGMFSLRPLLMNDAYEPRKERPFLFLKSQVELLADEIGASAQIWTTGHSLGAAYATITWQASLARIGPSQREAYRDIVTFGSPRVGNGEFAKHHRELSKMARSWRFVNGHDGVPGLPWWIMTYRHVDTLIEISPNRIKPGPSELGKASASVLGVDPSLSLPGGVFDGGLPVGDIPNVPMGKWKSDHDIVQYWKSLREGTISSLRRKAQQPEGVPAPVDGLVSWTLHDDHGPEHVVAEAHKDHGINITEPGLNPKHDMRRRVLPGELQPGGKYRAVVKLQSKFGTGDNAVWTMGSGWLIRKDLIVTAGQNVFSKTYNGRATHIKCWIGYCGRKSIYDQSVQYRRALNIITTEAWWMQEGNRRLRDIALIQVSEPFSGSEEELRLFKAISTPPTSEDSELIVVGYPGDKAPKNDKDDIGGWMFAGSEEVKYDLLSSESKMIEYPINTFGGQSGGPVLMVDDRGELSAIGVHCYRAAGRTATNSGNPIGEYGNNLETMKARLAASREDSPTPLHLQPSQPGEEPPIAAPVPDSTAQASFWDVLKTVSKVGSVVLPLAGPFLGPLGAALSTMAGAVLGSLAESSAEAAVDATSLDKHVERAQLAEAVLQTVMKLERSPESNSIFDKMQRIWERNHVEGSCELGELIHPMLSSYGLRLAEYYWSNRIEPNPKAKKLLEYVRLEEPATESYLHPSAPLLEALFKNLPRRLEGIPTEGVDSLEEWFSPLMEHAALAAPLVTASTKEALQLLSSRLSGGNRQKSIVLRDKDAGTSPSEIIVQRALMADCALQAVRALTEEQLLDLELMPDDQGLQECFIDVVKSGIQKIGPVALRNAQVTLKQDLPSLANLLGKVMINEEGT